MATIATSKDKAVQFIAKLLRLTQTGAIEWSVGPSPHDTDEIAFTASIEERMVRLYQFNEEVRTVTTWDDADTMLSIRPNSEKRITRSTALDVLSDGYVAYTFKNQAGLSDLYDSVAYAASKVEDLMDAVLAKA
jgi:hypothetical protein